MSDSLIPSFLVSDVCKSLSAHQKWATMSDSLRLLSGNEWSWANRSGRSPKMSKWVNRSFFERIAHSLIFGQKTSNSLGKPMSEFPALILTVMCTVDVHSTYSILSVVHIRYVCIHEVIWCVLCTVHAVYTLMDWSNSAKSFSTRNNRITE